MASPPCFRLDATRGPHNGVFFRHCHIKAGVTSSSASPGTLSIGRKKRCWLRLPKDLEVSSVHAEFRYIANDTRVSLRDVKSTNGTKLNGEPLKPHEDYPLSDGDLIAVGKTSLRFVQVEHGLPCGEETGSVNNTSTVLTASASSSAAPVVIVLDEDSVGVSEVSKAAGTGDPPADQPDTEPGNDQLVEMKQPKNVVVVSKKEGADDVGLSLPPKSVSAEKNGSRIGVLNECTPEKATCSVCSVVIGQLDLLEQQAHLNECLGGRVAARSSASRMTANKDAQPKTRKRGNAAGGATRAKKPKKPKTDKDGDDDAVAVTKTKKPRKRKRVDAGENIELALALTSKAKMSKEEQTDMQLTVTKKKLEQLDEQIAKLAKRRVNLVKTLDRLERTKEKLRKSQVLPPAKVLQLLDLKAALAAIFPGNRQAQPSDQYRHKKIAESGSAVAKQYTPARWNESGVATDCGEEMHAELAAVAAISMWARASQQLFGLQHNTLLYRNSVLRAFLGDDEDTDSSIMDLDNVGDVDDEDGDTGFEQEEEESEQISALRSTPPDHDAKSDHTEVPDVVKCVFPNWQRDLAFLHDQTVEELEMALEAMNEAQAQADAAAINNGESNQIDGCETGVSEGQTAEVSEVVASPNILSTREQQRLACNYMAQVMRALIDEKRSFASISELSQKQQQRSVIDLVDSSGYDSQQPVQQSSIDINENDATVNSYRPALENLPKAATGCASTEAKIMIELEAKLQQDKVYSQ